MIRRRRISRLARWLASGASLLFMVVFAVAASRLVRPPDWYLVSRGGPISDAVDAYRAANGPIFVGLIQMAGGLILLTGLWFSLQHLRLSKEQHWHEQLVQATNDLTHEAEFKRVASIGRLEALAATSDAMARDVALVLVSFIREKAPWNSRTIGDSCQDLRAALGACRRLVENEMRARPRGIELPEDRSQESVDLSGVRFGRVDLRRMNFDGLAFSRAVFDGTALDRASFNGGALDSATFRNCSVRGTSFGGTNLHRVVIDGSDFSDSRFDNNWVSDVRIAGSNFARTHLNRFHPTMGQFESVDFSNAIVTDSDLNGGEFMNCEWSGADTSRAYRGPHVVDKWIFSDSVPRGDDLW
jgi:uncharacterized protein YjbI with pentapeptide repeats